MLTFQSMEGLNNNLNTQTDKSYASQSLIFDRLKWLNTKEAAMYLRVSVGQMRNMVWRQQVKAYRLHNRLRFLRSDLDKLVKPLLETKEALWR